MHHLLNLGSLSIVCKFSWADFCIGFILLIVNVFHKTIISLLKACAQVLFDSWWYFENSHWDCCEQTFSAIQHVLSSWHLFVWPYFVGKRCLWDGGISPQKRKAIVLVGAAVCNVFYVNTLHALVFCIIVASLWCTVFVICCIVVSDKTWA